MSTPVSKTKTPRFWTPEKKKALSDWLAPLIVWIAVTGFLLAMLAALFAERP